MPVGNMSYDKSRFGLPEWIHLTHFILPFIEQSALYSEVYELQKTTLVSNDRPYANNVETRYATINRKFVAGYLCPSDGQGGKFAQANFAGYSSNAAWHFKTNYLPFYNGTGDDSTASQFSNPAWRGTWGIWLAAFDVTWGADFSAIEDGLSNTVIIGEYLTGPDSDSLFGCPISDRAGLNHIYPRESPNSSVRDGILNYPTMCNTFITGSFPCTPLADTNAARPNHAATTRSKHSGGVNVLAGDGSVKFLGNTTDLKTFKSMVYIANGSLTEASGISY
jgi:prepilin-type processing-associated H-X9-DG protein